MIGLQALDDLANEIERQLAVDGCATGAGAAVELIGRSLQRAEDHQLVDERDTLADLLLDRAGDVVFVQVIDLIGERVQAGVLIQYDRLVLRRDLIRRRRHAFRRLRGSDQRGSTIPSAVGDQQIAIGCRRGAIRQPATRDIGIAVVFRERHLTATARKHFMRDSVLQDSASVLANSSSSAHGICSHFCYSL